MSAQVWKRVGPEDRAMQMFQSQVTEVCVVEVLHPCPWLVTAVRYAIKLRSFGLEPWFGMVGKTQHGHSFSTPVQESQVWMCFRICKKWNNFLPALFQLQILYSAAATLPSIH